jgi:hypothetical protein
MRSRGREIILYALLPSAACRRPAGGLQISEIAKKLNLVGSSFGPEVRHDERFD